VEGSGSGLTRGGATPNKHRAVRGSVDAVFSALADPSRRFVVETLAARGTATPTELAADLPVTRQAVSKHLAALREAGLVEARRSGRETRYALTPAPLTSAAEWIDEVGAAWDARLAALRKLVDGPAAPG
jgi:DNA-binding transcriptional ArsR family regulator